MNQTNKRRSRFSNALIWLLVCSNLATALVACLVIDRLNERYAAELNGAVPGLHEVMLLAQESTNTHRAALNLLLAADETEKREVLQRLANARDLESKRLRLVFPEPPAPGGAREPLWDAATNYATALDHYLSLVAQGDRATAAAYRGNVLRTAFDNYQRRQREESIRLSFDAMRGGAEINALVTTRKGVLLGFGVWPLLLACIMLVLVGVLGAWLWHHVRKIELGESELPSEEPPRF